MKLHEFVPTLERVKQNLTDREFSYYSVVARQERNDVVTAIHCTLDTRRLNGPEQAEARISEVTDMIRTMVDDNIGIVVNATGHPFGVHNASETGE